MMLYPVDSVMLFSICAVCFACLPVPMIMVLNPIFLSCIMWAIFCVWHSLMMYVRLNCSRKSTVIEMFISLYSISSLDTVMKKRNMHPSSVVIIVVTSSLSRDLMNVEL